MASATLPPPTAALPDTAACAPLERCGHTGRVCRAPPACMRGPSRGRTRSDKGIRQRTSSSNVSCSRCGMVLPSDASGHSLGSRAPCAPDGAVTHAASTGVQAGSLAPTARASAAGQRTGRAAPGDCSHTPRPSEPSPARATVALQAGHCPAPARMTAGHAGWRPARSLALLSRRQHQPPPGAAPRPCEPAPLDRAPVRRCAGGPLQHGVQVPQAARSLPAGQAHAQLPGAQQVAQRSGARARDRVRDPPPACDERGRPELRRPE
jgi:hypothetical protein